VSQGVAEVREGLTFRLSLPPDNIGVETTPALPKEGPCPAMPLHEHCIFKLGIYLAELWLLARRLRANHRSRFLRTAPPALLARGNRIAGHASRNRVTT
jgi:hypothetical protein